MSSGGNSFVAKGAMPVALALFASLLWGLWWIPIRDLEELGLTGAWAGVIMAVGSLPFLGLALLFQRGDKGRVTVQALAGAVIIGLAVTLYATAITFTDVVRAVLLFYLAPAWSIALECLLLGRKWNRQASLALALSFIGVIVVFRGDISLSGWNAGDVMSLCSGLCWSIGSTLVFTAPATSTARISFATVLGSILTGGLALIIAGDAVGAVEQDIVIAAAAGWALLYGSLYNAPIALITLWAARKLPPATLSFILTGEIVAGVASSALLLDERFGWPEVIGGVLIISGALVEVIAPPVQRREGMSDTIK